MFEGWNGYFALLGSAAASLTGLLFVVATLTTSVERSRALWAAGVYMFPNALGFSVVLALAAASLAPPALRCWVAAAVASAGAGGFAAGLRSCLGILGLRRSERPPHWSDFWGYGALPAALHLGLVVDSLGIAEAWGAAAPALAGLLLALLLTSIRNTWDLITWMAPGGAGGPPPPPPQPPVS